MAGGILALRDRLQDYGRDLPDAALGQALLGLLWTFPFPRRDLTPRGRLSLVGWRLAPFGGGIDAAAAVAAWEALVRTTASAVGPTRHGIPVELVADPRPSRSDDERTWVLDLLGRTPGVAAVHLAAAPRTPPVPWTWPAQLALFDDAASRELRAKLAAAGRGAARRPGPRDLVTPISVARATRPIELLVLGGTLAAALSRLRDRAKLPRIHTVVVLGGLGRTSQPVKTAELLRRNARADAVCVVQVPDRREAAFLDAVLAGLFQDLDLDVALAAAARAHQLPPPLLVAAEGAFAEAHWRARPAAPVPPPARYVPIGRDDARAPAKPAAGERALERTAGAGTRSSKKSRRPPLDGGIAKSTDKDAAPPGRRGLGYGAPSAGPPPPEQRPPEPRPPIGEPGPGGEPPGAGAAPPAEGPPEAAPGAGERGLGGGFPGADAPAPGEEVPEATPAEADALPEADRDGLTEPVGDDEDDDEDGNDGAEAEDHSDRDGLEAAPGHGERGLEGGGPGAVPPPGATASPGPGSSARPGGGPSGAAGAGPGAVRPDEQAGEWAPVERAAGGVESILPRPPAGHPAPQVPPPREPTRRYLQAELFAGEPPRQVTTAPLAPGPHRLEVWIGPPHGGALIAGAQFPEQQLPPSADGHALTVVLAAPVLGEPQVAALWLPPGGASRRVGFGFAVPAGLARVEARISVLHAGRVLQTVVLAADVATGEAVPLVLALEGVIRRELDGIAGRPRFDAALIANRMSERRLVSVIAGDRASLVPTGTSIDRLVGEVSQLLAAATNNPARYGAPDSEGTTELLADLARKGYLLREALLDMPQVRAELERAARIQIVIARPDETTLPLELCYDGVAPGVGATMCPAWRAALEAGTCQAACPADRATVVCPVAFWGTHRVIERHAYAKVDAAQLAGNAYGLQHEPTAGRARLPITGGSVCAAAQAARAVDAAAVDRAFAEAGEVARPGSEATTWAEWRALIRGNPAILVLLAHSDMIKTNRALVIGAAETAMISDIGPALVGAGGGSGPIVLLLGCSTAIAETAFQSFVAQFRAAGAAIVIGTLCEILGQHAAPIAGQILAEIQRVVARGESIPLGDLIPALRRRLLARGYPIAMAIATYGDADWQI